MGRLERFMLGAVFAKKPELSKPEFYQRLGRFYITSEQTKEISKELEQEGLLKIIKRRNALFFQKGTQF